MVGAGPHITVDRPAGRRLGWEPGDERGDTPRGETTPAEVVDVDVVVPEEISLDRRPMVG